MRQLARFSGYGLRLLAKAATTQRAQLCLPRVFASLCSRVRPQSRQLARTGRTSQVTSASSGRTGRGISPRAARGAPHPARHIAPDTPLQQRCWRRPTTRSTDGGTRSGRRRAGARRLGRARPSPRRPRSSSACGSAAPRCWRRRITRRPRRPTAVPCCCTAWATWARCPRRTCHGCCACRTSTRPSATATPTRRCRCAGWRAPQRHWRRRGGRSRKQLRGVGTATTTTAAPPPQANARGYMAWRAALDRGLLPDDAAIQQIVDSKDPFAAGHSVEELRWPAEPLRTMLIRVLAKLGVSRFAQKYPGVKEALLKSVLEAVVKYNRTLAGIKVRLRLLLLRLLLLLLRAWAWVCGKALSRGARGSGSGPTGSATLTWPAARAQRLRRPRPAMPPPRRRRAPSARRTCRATRTRRWRRSWRRRRRSARPRASQSTPSWPRCVVQLAGPSWRAPGAAVAALRGPGPAPRRRARCGGWPPPSCCGRPSTPALLPSPHIPLPQAAAAPKKKAAAAANLPLDRRTAVELAKELYGTWQAPVDALSKAGKAFAGLEALLGGSRDGSFDLQVRGAGAGGWWQENARCTGPAACPGALVPAPAQQYMRGCRRARRPPLALPAPPRRRATSGSAPAGRRWTSCARSWRT